MSPVWNPVWTCGHPYGHDHLRQLSAPVPALTTLRLQVINIFFLYHPPLGTARSDVLTYLADHDGRLLSVLAGLLACFGDMAQFLAGQAVGYAVRPRWLPTPALTLITILSFELYPLPSANPAGRSSASRRRDF